MHLVGVDAAVDELARPQLQQEHAEAVHIRRRPRRAAVQRLGRGVCDGAWRTGGNMLLGLARVYATGVMSLFTQDHQLAHAHVAAKVDICRL